MVQIRTPTFTAQGLKVFSPVLTVLYINLNAMDLSFVDSSTLFFLDVTLEPELFLCLPG